MGNNATNKTDLNLALKHHLLPRALVWLHEQIRVRHSFWLCLVVLTWPGEQIVENGVVQTLALAANVVPFIGPWFAANAMDTVVDTILLFIGGPLPLACSWELLKRLNRRLGIIPNHELEVIDADQK